MPSTTKGFPYPANSDNVDVPGDMQALAEAIDTGLDSYLTTSSASTTYVRTSGGSTITNSASATVPLTIKGAASQSAVLLRFRTSADVDRASIDVNGRFTSNVDGNRVPFEAYQYTNDGAGPLVILGKSRNATIGSNTIVQNGDELGAVLFRGANGTSVNNAAALFANVDGTPGNNDMPGRLTFWTTPDGSDGLLERMRISSEGKVGVGSGYGPSVPLDVRDTANADLIYGINTHSTYASGIITTQSARAANSAYSFFRGISNSGGDVEFMLRGDGNGLCDGAWTGGGADYAEYFEWEDGNLNGEDRRGIAVTLAGDKIKPAEPGDTIIGVISGNPSVVGDAAWNKWSGKYLRDEYGTYVQEDYKVFQWTDEDGSEKAVDADGPDAADAPADATVVVQQRRKLNPDYDPEVEYVSREARPEWDCVGLMGKLRVRKGQPTDPRWIKMRDISATVEEWLLR